jgi:hypothetical protein
MARKTNNKILRFSVIRSTALWRSPPSGVFSFSKDMVLKREHFWKRVPFYPGSS